ncbi:hypothetical protein [uncultured Clostridium sp.]|uniref:hypothetical protein n=1 Tax=uncultured Clostridium sp. TaxID=59620 RepID=UPI00258C21CE|nr:hypothetical protein [uncultured Clostridium sp.]
MMNNADVGISVQNKICKIFDIEIEGYAKSQFLANSVESIEEKYENIIISAFKELGDKPINLLTYSIDGDGKKSDNAHNFILESGKTLSIRTNKKSKIYKIAPRVVGQAGYEKLNFIFGHLCDYKIESQEDIKKLVFTKIDKMLPIFIDYFFLSDYTIWIYEKDKIEYRIIERGECPDLKFNREDLSFTCGEINEWKESTTLKYKGISFAEIQVHSNRTFKFRFIMEKICDWLREIKINNETLGMTAEKVICDIFDLERESHLLSRSNKYLEEEIRPCLQKAFVFLPKAVMHTGSLTGTRGGTSKCSYDFLLEDNLTLSLKTNYGKKVCPPEVGQPGAKTFVLKFGEILGINEVDNNSFKKIVLEKIDIMMPVYLKYLLDSDYLLWIYKENDTFKHKIINSKLYKDFKWEFNKFSFTKQTVNDWNESNTLKYKGITIGEFQVHQKRNSYKFRFDMKNLLKILDEYRANENIGFVAEESTSIIK